MSQNGYADAAGGIYAPNSLVLRATSCYYPHPDKADYGGEDAHFISVTGAGAIGVADGVGGWRKQGVNPADYARTFMHNSCCWLERRLDELLEGPEREFPQPHLVAAFGSQAQTDALASLIVAHNITRVHGSSTACVMQLDGRSNCLTAANVGDSGFVVIRGRHVISHSMVLQHHFDCPLQLGHPDLITVTDYPEDADIYSIPVEPGDIVIMGTDGLWDNVFVEEILQLLPNCPDDLDSAAQRIAELAVGHAGDPGFRSPYSIEANKASNKVKWWHRLLGGCCAADGQLGMVGGKMDDITVVVGMVHPGQGRTTPDGIVRLPSNLKRPEGARDQAKRNKGPDILVLPDSGNAMGGMHDLSSVHSEQLMHSGEAIHSTVQSGDRGMLFTHTHSDRGMDTGHASCYSAGGSVGGSRGSPGDSGADRQDEWRHAPRADTNGVAGLLRGGQTPSDARSKALTYDPDSGDMRGSSASAITRMDQMPRTPNRPQLDPLNKRYFEAASSTPSTPAQLTRHSSREELLQQRQQVRQSRSPPEGTGGPVAEGVRRWSPTQSQGDMIVRDLEFEYEEHDPSCRPERSAAGLVSQQSAPPGMRLVSSEADLQSRRASAHSSAQPTRHHSAQGPNLSCNSSHERPSSAWLMEEERQHAAAAARSAASTRSPSKAPSCSSHHGSTSGALARNASDAAARMGGEMPQPSPALFVQQQQAVRHAEERRPAEPAYMVSDFEGPPAGHAAPGRGLPGSVQTPPLTPRDASSVFDPPLPRWSMETGNGHASFAAHTPPSRIPAPPKGVTRW